MKKERTKVSLSELIDEFVNGDPNADTRDIAEKVLARLMRDRDSAMQFLLPLVAHAITTRWRIAMLRTERASVLEPGPADPTADRQAFLAERFYVPDVGFVTWEEATVAHHEARIEFLSKKIVGLEQTVARHQEAIELIQAAGRAKNLRDVYTRKQRKAS